eukprot:TRINITY_DN48856_c0_g1_i1.p1 TRINITY_DN48856_c0_g1~~TRINITY_DN48856_c0_g1_i1.p1  ORF type:complete len:612 (+),score=73.33 TRINITY_DN48856_c0_g1_i1:119-1954(+)
MSSASSFIQTVPLQKIIDQYQNQADKGFEQNDLLCTYVRELRGKLGQLEEFVTSFSVEDAVLQPNQQELSAIRDFQNEFRSPQGGLQTGQYEEVDNSQQMDNERQLSSSAIQRKTSSEEDYNYQMPIESVLYGVDFLVGFWKEYSQQAQFDQIVNVQKQNNFETLDIERKKQKLVIQHAGLLHIQTEASNLLQKLNEMIDSSKDDQLKVVHNVTIFLEELNPIKEGIQQYLTEIDQQEVAKIEGANKKISDQIAEIKDLQDKLQVSQEEILNYQTQIEQAQFNEQQVSDRDEHIQQLNLRLKEMEEKVNNSATGGQDDYAVVVAQNSSLEHTFQEDLKEVHQHKQMGGRLSDIDDSTPDLEVEVHFLKTENQRLKAENQMLTVELEELGQQYVDSNKAHSRAHNQLFEVKHECEQKNRQIEKLRQQVIDSKDNTKDVQSMFKDMQQEMNELKSRLAKKDAQIEQLENSLGEAEQFAKDLEQQLHVVEREGADNDTIIRVYDHNRCLQQQVQELERAYKDKKGQLELQEAQNQDLEDRNQYLIESNNKLKEKVSDLTNASQRLLRLVERKNAPGTTTRGPTPGSQSNRGTPSKQGYRDPTPKSPRGSRNSIE